METGKKIHYKELILPAAFAIFLILTIFLHQWSFSLEREELGTEVLVKVTDIRIKNGIQSGGLDVTVSYQGELYKLHGVPSSEHFVMKNSKTYNWSISAILYDGKMYYGSASVMLIQDKLYFASLGAALLFFCLMFLQLKNKLLG